MGWPEPGDFMKPLIPLFISACLLTSVVKASPSINTELILSEVCEISTKHCAVLKKLDLQPEGMVLYAEKGSYLLRGAKETSSQGLRIETGYNSRGIFFVEME
jgi:hypothetical protein